VGSKVRWAYGDSQFGFRANLQEYFGALRYGVLGHGCCLFIGAALNPFLGEYLPYLTLFPALAFCAWYCGVGPSILSVTFFSSL